MAEKNSNIAEEKKEEKIILKGKYINFIGKRKTATARIRLYKKGKGLILINGVKTREYFTTDQNSMLKQPLKLTGNLRDLNFSIIAKGGSKNSQAEAIRHGISLALVSLDKDLKPSLKVKGWLTRDARKKERKKPGLKKARKAPQWSKR